MVCFYLFNEETFQIVSKLLTKQKKTDAIVTDVLIKQKQTKVNICFCVDLCLFWRYDYIVKNKTKTI
jgi:hypothetical protein